MSTLALKGGTPVRTEPFTTWPVFDERDQQVLLDVLGSREWGGFPSPNRWAAEFARKFAELHDAKYGICAFNGTVTLEIALKAGGIKAGDEVIVPALTWVATAMAAVTVNAVPVFVDVDPDTYCLDPLKIEAALTDRTRAIIPVHLGCRMADMDAIMEIAQNNNLIVVEDCAHAHGAKWRNKGAGSFGHFGSFSFQSSKLMTAGEGGIILTNDKEFEERCQSYVNCGRKETGYNSYDGSVAGWNYRISEWQAAILSVGCERLAEQTAKREENIAYLAELIADVPGLEMLGRDERLTTMGAYQLIMRYNKQAMGGVHRDRFVEAVNAEGVDCDGYFYIPLYDSPLFTPFTDEFPMLEERYGVGKDYREAMRCPVAEKAAFEQTVWFHHPLFMGGTKDVEDIAAAIKKVAENIGELDQAPNAVKDRG